MASFNSCAVSTNSTGKLPMAEIRDVAKQYERRGMKPEAALLRSLEDRLEMAQMAERQIVQAVRGAYAAKGGRPRPAPTARDEGVRYSVAGDAPRITIGEIPDTGSGFAADTRKYLTEVLPERFKLYRSVWVRPGEAPRLDDPGAYWAETYEGASRSGFPSGEGRTQQVVLEVDAERDNIDVSQSISRRRQYGEPEIVLRELPSQARIAQKPQGVRYSVSGDVTDSPAFKKWFDGSAVVDEDGKPLMVFHGTDQDFNSFAKEKLGEATGAQSAAQGFFFVSRPDVATSYANYAAMQAPVRRELLQSERAEKRGDWDGYDAALQRAEELEAEIGERPQRGQNVLPVYLSIKNPAIMDAEGETFHTLQDKINDFIKSAKRKGHDGVILKNLDDDPNFSDRVGDHYIAFRPEQIKSATGNNGDFSPDNPDIRYSAALPEAAAPLAAISPLIQKLADGGAVVVHADASTLPGGRAPAGVQALTERDGTIHLVASSLTDANARAVLLHEAFHAGAEKLIGTAQWNKLMQRLESLQKLAQGGRGAARDFYDKAAQRVASARARGAVAAGMETEEFGAYTIEEYESAPPSLQKWVRDFIGMVKAWALARFGAQLGDVTPAQLSGLARLALLDVRAERMQRAQPAYSDRRADQRDTPDRRHTVEFQGKRRPIENSRGQLLAEDMNKQLAFYRWFKDSAVVDEQQRPLVVFHGTGDDITAFDENKGKKFDTGWLGRGFYFTTSEETAQDYADFKEGNADSNIMPVYLSIQNPYYAKREDKKAGEKAGEDGDPNYARKFVQKLIEQGYDGVVLDYGREGHGTTKEMEWVVFSPEQIKSVVGNSGTFDPANADIRYSVMPDWLNNMPQETQEAARKAGIWAKQVPLAERLKALRARAWGEFNQGMFDQFAPLMRLNFKAYILARLTKSADAPLESLLLYGKPFLNNAGAIDVNLERGGLIGVLKELQGEHDRFFAWIAGNRAARLKTEGRENLFTDTDISSLKDLSNGTMPDGTSRQRLYEQTLLKFNGYSRAVIDIAEKAGIIDGASRAVWENDFYVPFYRVSEDGKKSGPKMGGAELVNQFAFQKLRGGTDELSDLMHNTMRNWAHLLSASLNNQAAAAAIRAAHAQGIADPAMPSEKNAVFFLENGQPQYYVVNDALVMDAITALEWAGWNNPMMKAFQKAKHYLTAGVTISPEFKIANLARDQLAAVAQNPVSGNIMRNLVDGWQGTDKDSPLYAKMLAGGGLMRFGTFLEGDRAEHVKRLIDSGVSNAQILTTPARVKGLLSAAWDGWQEVGDRSENITRAAIYKQRMDQLVKLGFNADDAHLIASFAARDSMDFSLQGKWVTVRFLSQLVPFLNARLQGLYKLGRDGVAPTARMVAPRLFGPATASDKAKAKRFGATVMAVSMASIALMLAQAGDDDYDALEEWKRDAYWCIKFGGTMFFIPKPFEIGALGTLAERGLEMMMNGMDKEARELFAKRMRDMLMNTFAMNPTPQLVKPFIDLYANKNSFTGRPIETPDLERLSKSERIGPRTSATAQLLGKVTGSAGLSPVQIDHLINGYFGWLGAHAVMTADFAVRPLMGLPDQPARRFPDDYMVMGRFAAGLPADQSKYVTKFYEQAREVQEAMADIRHYQALGLKWKVDDLKEDHKDTLKIAGLYETTQRDLGEINKEIKITQFRKLTPEQKRERIDFLTQKRNELAKKVEVLRKKKEAPPAMSETSE